MNGQAYPKDTPAAYAIALLIDLAQRGEIDPWDVQVIEVIDRCLSELIALTEIQPGVGIADLSQSGQAFVDASLLVLLKANTLEQLNAEEENSDSNQPEEEWLDGEDWESETGLPRNLERQLRRRPSAQPPTYRRVTLQELIEQLQLVAAAIEKKSPRTRTSTSRSQSRTQVMRAALELVHQENSLEIASELEQFLLTYYSQLTGAENWLDLEQLLIIWAHRRANEAKEPNIANGSTDTQPPEIESDNSTLSEALSHYPSLKAQLHDRVGIFWALLLLSAQSKVELVQEEFYQDLKIRTL